MLLLLTAFYLSRGHITGAVPLSSVTKRSSSTCQDLEQSRSIWDIIRSSLVTIFLTTWVAFHPNIPRPVNNGGKGRLERWLWSPLCIFVSRQLSLFILALLIPEYILAWAIRQFIIARRIAKKN